MNRWICGVVLGILTLSSQLAFAGCFADTEVTSAIIQVSPEVDCLVLDVIGAECVGGATLLISNACPEPFEVDQECSGCTLRVEPGEERELQIPLEDGEITEHQVLGSLGPQTIAIDLEYEGQITDSYEGCSATGQSAPEILGLAFLLMGFRRTRS